MPSPSAFAYAKRRLRRRVLLPLLCLTVFAAGYWQNALFTALRTTTSLTPSSFAGVAYDEPVQSAKWRGSPLHLVPDPDPERHIGPDGRPVPALEVHPLLEVHELPPTEKDTHSPAGADPPSPAPPPEYCLQNPLAASCSSSHPNAGANEMPNAGQVDRAAQRAKKVWKGRVDPAERARTQERKAALARKAKAQREALAGKQAKRPAMMGGGGRNELRPVPLRKSGKGAEEEAKAAEEKEKEEEEERKAKEREKEGEERLEEHVYQDDGLLRVNPQGAHPIFELIERGEKRWAEMHARASTTLDEAVLEYHRRYKRAPPLGFDAWWFYVEENNVLLPDEYDQIHDDLQPFWGIAPADLQAIEEEWEAQPDSYTIGKALGEPIEVRNFSLPGHDERARSAFLGAGYELIEILEDVQDFIPPFRAIFSPHDNPNLPFDWELKELAVNAALKREHIDLANPPAGKWGWLASCAPSSPARTTPFDLDHPPPPRSPTNKTFIHDPKRAMDPCLHPALLHQHGQFLSHNEGPVPHRRFVPQFSYSTTLLHQDLRPAMPNSWVGGVADDLPWEERVDERLMWRGSNTGIWHAKDTRWRGAQRIRLVEAANNITGVVPVLRANASREERVGDPVEWKRARVAPAMMDVAFAGSGPINCPRETCEELEGMFEWRRYAGSREAGRYKYVYDADGNGWSSRFKRLITSNALVFKSTVYPEWFHDRLIPWVHYVPIQNDYSDLYDALAFFRGDGSNGEGGHDDLAKKIAYAGKEWSQRYWRKEDLTAYMFRLFLEYARVMSADRDAMSFYDWDMW